MRAARLALATLAVVAAGTGGAPRSAAAEHDEVAALLAALTSGGEGERVRAASRLYHIGRAELGVSRIGGLLRHEEAPVRAEAARLLGLLRTPDAVPLLVAALSDPDWEVRRDALGSLGQIGDRPTAATAGATRLLSDPHPSVRGAAARTLAELDAPRADVALARALRHEEEPSVALHLVEALGALSSRRALRALESALGHELESVRLLAAGHALRRGSGRGARLLAARLSSESPRVRSEAAATLGRATGAATEEARSALPPLLADVDPAVQLAAAESLASLGDGRGVRHLDALARGTASAAVRARARTVLDRLARASAREGSR